MLPLDTLARSSGRMPQASPLVKTGLLFAPISAWGFSRVNVRTSTNQKRMVMRISRHVRGVPAQVRNASEALTFDSSTLLNLVKANFQSPNPASIITVVIFLDETESLVRVYEREAEDEDVIEVATALRVSSTVNCNSPYSDGIPSLGTFRSPPVSLSPTSTKLQSQPPPSSPLKRRRFTDEDVEDNRACLESPIAFTNASLNFSPSVSHHSHNTSFDFGRAFDVPHTGSVHESVVVDGPELDLGSTELSPRNETGLSPTYIETAIWPLSSIEEAKLMRYFVDHLAVWFDLCDPLRHFALVVPQRAAICPPLLYAVFAVSARHLSRVGTYDPYAADRYYEKCLNHLTKMMDDEAASMDENLLAATVVLRWLEEIEVPLSGFDLQSHLVGTSALISAQESASHPPSGLRQAAFWVALRQEIYIAFTNQRIVRWNLDRSPLDHSFSATDDCTWANRMVLCCAVVLKFCFDTEGDHTVSRWAELRRYCERWRSSLPDSFSPIYYSEPSVENDDVLPQVWHIGDAHVTGIQHYILCMILLAVYNPSLPRLGPGQRMARKSMDEEIKGLVLTLAGMAVSNCQTPPNMITACMGIYITGERFSERRIQDVFLDILVRTEREFAWPTEAAQISLKDAWGWEREA
ncbi:hypothetical protein MMC18_003932 [Xylographa bjoerkii]|nr:hypothetical protein [Xylographa bjoerkii]